MEARKIPGTTKSKMPIGGRFEVMTTPTASRLVDEPISVVMPPRIET